MRHLFLVLLTATLIFNDGHEEVFDYCYDGGYLGGGYSVSCQNKDEKVKYVIPKSKIDRMIYPK